MPRTTSITSYFPAGRVAYDVLGSERPAWRCSYKILTPKQDQLVSKGGEDDAVDNMFCFTGENQYLIH
jgi:hypothetical protein